MRFSLLRKFIGRKSSSFTRPKPVRVRPRLELLEDRTLLSADPLTWSVQSDYFGTVDSAGDPYSLRGLALSSDNTSLYGGFIQYHDNGAAIREVSTTGAGLIGNDAEQGGDPAYTNGLEAVLPIYSQAKGLATDDRGYVYATLSSNSNSTTQDWAINNANLSVTEVTESSTNYTASSQLSGIATAEIDGNYYVYVGWKNGQIERWNVDNPTDPVLDTSWGSAVHPGIITLKSFNSNAYLNGLAVDSNGDIYVAGGLSGTTAYGDSLIKITAAQAASDSLSSLATVSVGGGANGTGGPAAMDVALFNGQAYVTEYLQSNSTIAVFNMSDLSSAGTITPTNPTGPSQQSATFPTGADSGFSGIAISPTGQIYVAEQLYNSTTDYTPPGSSNAIPGTTDFDRILVSSAQGAAPAITSADSATFTVGTYGSFTVTTTGSPAPSLSEDGTLPNGVTFADNGDGTATLAGTPDAGTAGTYTFSITASNGFLPNATQTFTLYVNPFSNGGSLLVLNPTGRPSLNASGSADISVTDGGSIIVDSSNSEGALASGNAQVSATTILDHGTPGTKTRGHGTFSGSITSGAPVVADPFSSLATPAQPATVGTNLRIGRNDVVTLQPGTYVGGIQVSGNAVVYLEPGIYYFVNGGLTVTGQAQVLMAADADSNASPDTGTGVLLYEAATRRGASISIGGQAVVNLQAPTSGTWQGIALFEAQTSTAPISVSSRGQLTLNGTLYAAGARVTVSGYGDLTLTNDASLIAFDLNDASNGKVNLES